MTQFVFKFVVAGPSGSGKTCLVDRLIHHHYKESYEMTIGVEFSTKILNEKIKVHLWDTAGQLMFRAITRSYFKNVAGAFLVFDVTNNTSFEQMKEWWQDLQENSSSSPQIMVIANKIDCKNRLISTQEASEWARQHNCLYMEVSAKTGENCDQMLLVMTNELLQKIESNIISSHHFHDYGIHLHETQTPSFQKWCCW